MIRAAVLVVVAACAPPAPSACERELRDGDPPRAVALCIARYAQTGDDLDLARAARAELNLGDLGAAHRWATRLLAGPRAGDGHAVLSYVALRLGEPEEATAQAILARARHAVIGDDRGLVRDDIAISQIAWREGDFGTALDAADRAIARLPAIAEPHLEVLAHVARADALRRAGDGRGASASLQRAIASATAPCDRAWAQLKDGMVQDEAGQPGLALVELEAAARANQRCQSRDVASQVAINQAWLWRARDPGAARAALDRLIADEGVTLTSLLLRSYLAADRGDWTSAARDLADAERLEPPDADWPWELARARGELAERAGDDLAAEAHYRRAIAMVAALRAANRAQAAYLVASHRGPYDDLIALLARAGRWRDALDVVLALDASDMLRATADATESVGRGHADLTEPTRMTAPAGSAEAVLAAWRGRDLVIVIAPSPRPIAGDDRAYRMRLHDGTVSGEAVAAAVEARRWAHTLFTDPGDAVAATALGHIVVPPGQSRDPLYVLAIGSLGQIPLAALRDRDGALVIARRPLVRMLALAARRGAAPGDGPPVVIADALGDLPSAFVEGIVVTASLGARARRVGGGAIAPATAAELWRARTAAVLHVAGHVVGAGRRRALRLADGDVAASELARRGVAPRLAVLAACGSAAATDDEGWGSIAAALLDAGTAFVIATDRSVRDDTALAVARAFYAQPDWRDEPARALARVQGDLAARRDPSWAAFAVLGRP